MKRVFMLLVSVGLVSAEAPAARMSLLDLLGGGSRNDSISQQNAADDSRKPIRVEHDAEAADVSTNDTPSAVTNTVIRTAPKREGRPAHISANKVYYDRKEGYAVFTGKVHVDGEEYQLHAQKAYVFFEGTNELKRIVATGSVAVTNETKRAYGAKASYYRKTGMVVLYGDDNAPAEVRDENKGEDQIVKGSKIKFWIDSEQVEVIDARISAPVSGGLDDLKDGLMK